MSHYALLQFARLKGNAVTVAVSVGLYVTHLSRRFMAAAAASANVAFQMTQVFNAI